ncbi:hypothetical protein [Streptomyces sp. NPDC058307]|uniref:hypothetical protein n=1 Tax=Streptomyces sp. NPDC058307 TaxID=3346439 RepID=UPI0036F15F6C
MTGPRDSGFAYGARDRRTTIPAPGGNRSSLPPHRHDVHRLVAHRLPLYTAPEKS